MFTCIGVSLVSLAVFVWGLTRLSHKDVTITATEDQLPATFSRDRPMGKVRMDKIAASSVGRQVKVEQLMDARVLFAKLRERDRSAIDFAARALGLAAFVIFALFAVGFGMVAAGESAGWGFVGFLVLFIAAAVSQVAGKPPSP